MNHFDVLRKTIAENDGAIVKTIGDAVMAVFRSPVSALRAMIATRQLLAAPVDGSRPLVLKAGLHRGPCIALEAEDLVAAPFDITLKGFEEQRFELWRVGKAQPEKDTS